MHPFYGQELIFFSFYNSGCQAADLCAYLHVYSYLLKEDTSHAMAAFVVTSYTHKICCLVCLFNFIFANQTTKLTIKIIKKKNLAIFSNSVDIFTISLIQEGGYERLAIKKKTEKRYFTVNFICLYRKQASTW